ncbi:MAG TPA: hypothetical protein VG838_11430 [Opitutaceae bacterium]|nr:hypothetical protein [Opitutaceae bacterium]
MAKSTPAPPAPSHWSNNNLACAYTWADLNFIKELDTTFDQSEKVTMNQFRFWNNAASPDVRRLDAQNVAAQLAKMFSGVNFAKYESGKSYTTAVDEMTDLLVVATKTVADLAQVVDDNYNFFGEIKPQS